MRYEVYDTDSSGWWQLLANFRNRKDADDFAEEKKNKTNSIKVLDTTISNSLIL